LSIAIKRICYVIDHEKAFDRFPREVAWWALWTLGVDEWIVAVVQAMYADASTW